MQHKIWNGLVLALGTTCVLSPDLTRLGPWLMSLGMGWSIHLIHVLGGLALLTAEWKTFKKHILASKTLELRLARSWHRRHPLTRPVRAHRLAE